MDLSERSNCFIRSRAQLISIADIDLHQVHVLARAQRRLYLVQMSAVEVGDGPAALDRGRMRAWVVQLDLGDHVSLRKRALGTRGVADFRRRYTAQVQAYRASYGGNLTDDLLRQMQVPQQVLQQMIQEKAEISEAERNGIDILIRADEITFTGFSPSELLGRGADRGKISVAANVLALTGRR